MMSPAGIVRRETPGGNDLILLTGAAAATVTPPRVFSGLTLCAVSADAIIKLGVTRMQVPAGSVIFLTPYAVHAWATVPGDYDAIRTVHLSTGAVSEALVGGPHHDEPWTDRRAAVIASPTLETALRDWHRAAAELSGMIGLDIVASIAEAYSAGSRLPFSNAAEHRSVTRVLKFLHRDRPSAVSMESVCAHARLSAAHFSRLFRDGVGLSPIAYYKQVRLAWGREQLATHDPAFAVAHAGGFSDQSHFTRDFTRTASVSPGRFSRCLTGRKRDVTG